METLEVHCLLSTFASWSLVSLLPLASVSGLDSAGGGVHGFADTQGGGEGQVIRVTTLDSHGPGTLREALETKGPRIVVFEVGGIIDLDKQALEVTEPFLTVAGQTAPSPGITIIRGPFRILTHDVVLQHIRVRPGDAGEPKGRGWEPDGISVSGGEAYNVIIDHCSISWAVDENLSASGPRLAGPDATSHKVTFNHCIIAEGLSHSTHQKGEHSKGSLVHDFCREIAVIGNLYAHNARRNPYFKAHTTGVIVNNVIYNPGKAAIQLGFSAAEWEGSSYEPENCRVAVVGNVLIHGSDTEDDLPLVAHRGDAYLEDNQAFGAEGQPRPLVGGNITRLNEKPVWPAGLVPLASNDVIDDVVEHAGARPRDRDEIDKRIIAEFVAREGRIIDSQDDVGGYPKHELTTRGLDVPEQGMRVWLEKLARELE